MEIYLGSDIYVFDQKIMILKVVLRFTIGVNSIVTEGHNRKR